jgi:hypothetical protein
MVVWTGAGILVLLVAVIGWAIGVSLGGAHFGGPIGLLASGGLLWLVGRKLNDPSNDRILYDPATGGEVRAGKRHTLFWIRMEHWGVLVVIIGVVAFFMPQTSATNASVSSGCSDDAMQKRVVSKLLGAKQNLADGHYAIAIRQSRAIENTAAACIRADDSADMYHYVHSFAAMIEAQARMATGDTKGLSIFMDAQTEAQELADKSDIDPDLQKMAKNLVGMAHFEMKEIQSSKAGDLIKPPPSPTP